MYEPVGVLFPSIHAATTTVVAKISANAKSPAMTPAQLAAYGKAMEAAGRAAAAAADTAAATQRQYDQKVRLSRSADLYASLTKAPYPPPAPPIIQEAQASAAEAKRQANLAAAAMTKDAAMDAAEAAAAAAATAARKAASAPNNPEARAAAATGTAAIQTAATAVSRWTKEPVAVVTDRLEQTGAQIAAMQAQSSAGGLMTMLNGVAQIWAKSRLDWRFWTGIGAAAYGTWLRLRR